MKTISNLPAAIIFILAAVGTTTVVAEENALSAALPSTAALSKQEECSEQQHKLMASIGLGEAACTISKYVSFESISKAIGTSAFQPNSRNNPLNPSDKVEDFVRYSPQFFTRINELYSKDADNAVYSFFYNHFLDNSTRLFYMTGRDLRDNKNLKAITLSQYKKAAIDSKQLYKISNMQCKDTQASMIKTFGTDYHYEDTFKQCSKSGTAALFWYRRQLDGSSDALFALLDTMMKTQDEQFYSQLKLAVKTTASQPTTPQTTASKTAVPKVATSKPAAATKKAPVAH